jgi:hypothetical protein
MSWQYWLKDIDDPELISERHELELQQETLRQRWEVFVAKVNRRYQEQWALKQTHLCDFCKTRTTGKDNCQNCGAPRTLATR